MAIYAIWNTTDRRFAQFYNNGNNNEKIQSAGLWNNKGNSGWKGNNC
jgi:hypothetical protein